MYRVLKLVQPFEGNHEADVAPGEHEFDTLALSGRQSYFYRVNLVLPLRSLCKVVPAPGACRSPCAPTSFLRFSRFGPSRAQGLCRWGSLSLPFSLLPSVSSFGTPRRHRPCPLQRILCLFPRLFLRCGDSGEPLDECLSMDRQRSAGAADPRLEPLCVCGGGPGQHSSKLLGGHLCALTVESPGAPPPTCERVGAARRPRPSLLTRAACPNEAPRWLWGHRAL